ncbi:cold shock domain-containing protein [Paracoccus sp. S-4012]|uniref:cold-shock protein n=1 Tax=Paracoccus sp. S-4012 TaxID=2665648 RepID=UPI0012B129F9|nr:cold shock domain-containing protein [Paracoccus sp. S-4012]MRX50349.1 cold shock domain-containing protein [Paracoccus sp. S-4012]
MEAVGEPCEITGQIKWFDPDKGFGFILDAAGGPDILLHANVLRNFGQSSVTDGARIRATVVPTRRGRQAVAVLEITAPAPDAQPAIADLAGCDQAALALLPWRAARVKWFDKAKGFGFATLFGETGDVFLHVEVLRHGGFSDLAVGEAVALRVVSGQRGPMAAQIGAWDRPAATAGDAPLPVADDAAHLDGRPRLVAGSA